MHELPQQSLSPSSGTTEIATERKHRTKQVHKLLPHMQTHRHMIVVKDSTEMYAQPDSLLLPPPYLLNRYQMRVHAPALSEALLLRSYHIRYQIIQS